MQTILRVPAGALHPHALAHFSAPRFDSIVASTVFWYSLWMVVYLYKEQAGTGDH